LFLALSYFVMFPPGVSILFHLCLLVSNCSFCIIPLLFCFIVLKRIFLCRFPLFFIGILLSSFCVSFKSSFQSSSLCWARCAYHKCLMLLGPRFQKVSFDRLMLFKLICLIPK
jgi:hypothetical protein